ncbi:MAG: hypothetical protein IKE74_04225 [Mogibacterium sp.]|nr:hypothetical protein [Mogibacterium sp.]
MVTVRGTTPTITFRLPFQTDQISNCEIYFAQKTLLFQKNYDDCSFEENKLMVRLSQEETLMLDEGLTLRLQIRFVFANGSVGGTRIVNTSVVGLLKEGEINVGY